MQKTIIEWKDLLSKTAEKLGAAVMRYRYPSSTLSHGRKIHMAHTAFLNKAALHQKPPRDRHLFRLSFLSQALRRKPHHDCHLLRLSFLSQALHWKPETTTRPPSFSTRRSDFMSSSVPLSDVGAQRISLYSGFGLPPSSQPPAPSPAPSAANASMGLSGLDMLAAVSSYGAFATILSQSLLLRPKQLLLQPFHMRTTVKRTRNRRISRICTWRRLLLCYKAWECSNQETNLSSPTKTSRIASDLNHQLQYSTTSFPANVSIMMSDRTILKHISCAYRYCCFQGWQIIAPADGLFSSSSLRASGMSFREINRSTFGRSFRVDSSSRRNRIFSNTSDRNCVT